MRFLETVIVMVFIPRAIPDKKGGKILFKGSHGVDFEQHGLCVAEMNILGVEPRKAGCGEGGNKSAIRAIDKCPVLGGDAEGVEVIGVIL